MKKIAFFLNGYATRGAICAYELCVSLNEMGYNAQIYALGFDEFAPPGIRKTFSLEALSTNQWWKCERLDFVVFYGFGFTAEQMRLAKNSGATVICECDSDGRISIAQEPGGYLRDKMWDDRYPRLQKLKILKAWLGLLLQWRTTEREILARVDCADLVKIESERPAQILKAFLRHRARPDLADKVVVIPFAVRAEFTNGNVCEEKENLVVAAGRLGSQQKDPALLTAIVREISISSRDLRVELHVRGDLREFEGLHLLEQEPRVYCNSSSQFVAERLSKAKIFLSSSRWETTPIIGLEALSLGCSLVAPVEVPGYASLIADGKFGTAYRTRSAQEAARAVASEYDCWEEGRRNAYSISQHWRDRVSLSRVAQQWAALMENGLVQCRGGDVQC